MTKTEQSHLADSIFQLELNLHDVSRELTLMIEDFEKQDCFICLQLKCRCVLKSPKKNSDIIRDGYKNNTTSFQAPDSLLNPKVANEAVESIWFPQKGKSYIERWIEASKAAQKAKTDRQIPNDVLVASIKKSWSDSRSELKKERIREDFKKDRIIFDPHSAAASAVEVFFNRFKLQPITTNTAYITNVTEAFAQKKSKNYEYSYF